MPSLQSDKLDILTDAEKYGIIPNNETAWFIFLRWGTNLDGLKYNAR